MRGSDFPMIDNYKKMLQCFERGKDPCNDQEVPNSQLTITSGAIKTEIKTEHSQQSDVNPPLAEIISGGFNYTCDVPDFTSQSCKDANRTLFQDPQYGQSLPLQDSFLPTPMYPTYSSSSNQISCSQTAMLSSSSSSSVPFVCPAQPSNFLTAFSPSVQTIPLSLSSLDSSSIPSSIKTQTNSKTTTFVTGLAGSGCTVTTNCTDVEPNVKANYFDALLPEETLEYTDLDKPISFYDEFEPIKSSPQCQAKKPLQRQGSFEALEDAIKYFQEVLSATESLNIPLDPTSWSYEQVHRWVRWVCQKNEFADVSHQIPSITGLGLSSWSDSDFIDHFGTKASDFQTELDVWKAVNGYMSEQSQLPQTAMVSSQSQLYDDNSFIFSSSTTSTATSPASSPSSSLSYDSPDSHDSFSSARPELPQENKNCATPCKVQYPDSTIKHKILHKRISGRGHKKALTLWKFIRRLLLEKSQSCICWLDENSETFKIIDSKKLATLWGEEKNCPKMSYDKLSRSLRQYYKKGIMKKPNKSKRLVYQFCPEFLSRYMSKES